MKIIQINPRDLINYPKNAKKHSKNQIDKLELNIKRFGFLVPIVIHGNTILAGHARVQAACNLELNEIPAVNADHLTEMEKRAFVIADNKLSQFEVSWDEEMLTDELLALSAAGFDLDDIAMGDFFPEIEDKEVKDESIDFSEKHEVIVECADEEQQKNVFDELIERGYKCRVLSI